MGIKYLDAVQGSQGLGLSSLSVKDFTAHEFEIMSYLQGQIRKMASTQKAGARHGKR